MVAPGGPDEKADKLLELLVEFVGEQVTGELFVKWVHEEVAHAMSAAEKLTLREVITPQQVRGVAIKYSLEWRIEDTFVDILGETAVRIHDRLFAPDATLNLESGITDIAVRLQDLPAFQRLAAAIYRSEFVKRAASALVYQAALDSLKRNRTQADTVPGLSRFLQLGSNFADRFMPDADQRADAMLHSVSDQLASMVTRDKTDPADVAHNIVAAIKASAAAEDFSGLTASITADDIEDVLVLLFELIRDARTTRPLRTAIEESINVFFERYGDYSLARLLGEMGITAEDMIEEALRFAPRPIGVLQANGMLADMTRRRFRAFAESPEVKALLEN